MSNQHFSTNDPHARRNDAQLAHYRRNRPDAWQHLLDTMSEAERAEAIARADAAELESFIGEWDTRADGLARVAGALRGEGAIITATCPRCQQPISKDGTCGCNLPATPRTHVTAQMVADIWQDENGPWRVAALLRSLPTGERNRIAVAYWNLLRQSGCHEVSLHEVGIQFELAMLKAA